MKTETGEFAAPIVRQRYPALDSLRGLAALSVMLSHVALFAPYAFLLHTPLQAVMQGRSAVILFFILSGFVLALQIKARNFEYFTYALKRFFRIYPAYIVSIALAVVCVALVGRRDVSSFGMSGVGWGESLNLLEICNHMQMIFVPFYAGRFNGVIWSLIYEMRISLIFPFIMYGFYRFGIPFMLAFGSVCTALYCVLEFAGISNAGNMGAWLPTLQYLTMFIYGAALAKSLVFVKKRVHNPKTAYTLFFLGVGLYVAATPIAHRTTGIAHLQVLLSDAIVIAGVLAIMASTFSNTLILKILEQRTLVALGTISYSLYLFHMVIFNLLVHMLAGHVPPSFIVALEFVLAIAFSFLSYHAIELPGIRLGAMLISRFSPRAVGRIIVGSSGAVHTSAKDSAEHR